MTHRNCSRARVLATAPSKKKDRNVKLIRRSSCEDQENKKGGQAEKDQG
jgi:hypothetical protein